jgi:hypothetical protein
MSETLDRHLTPGELKAAVVEYDQAESARRYLDALCDVAGRTQFALPMDAR